MTAKNPYQVIKHRHVTEKAAVLQELHTSDSNPSVRGCETAKYVFIVDPLATKTEIRHAVEEIYKEKSIKVTAVNTITGKRKPRRVRGRKGQTAQFKKAVVTLAKGDILEDV